jgi:hypothetical protein
MLKRFILWDYGRGSWQYDVMVGIILAFIFLMPRGWFRDQPRIPRASSITVLPAEHGSSQFLVDPALLAGVPAGRHADRVSELLQKGMGNPRLRVTRVEPIRDSEGELQGYIAVARP